MSNILNVISDIGLLIMFLALVVALTDRCDGKCEKVVVITVIAGAGITALAFIGLGICSLL